MFRPVVGQACIQVRQGPTKVHWGRGEMPSFVRCCVQERTRRARSDRSAIPAPSRALRARSSVLDCIRCRVRDGGEGGRRAEGRQRRRAYDRGPRRSLRATDPEVPPVTVQQTDIATLRMVIGGETVDASDGQRFDVVNPATGKVIATAPQGGKADVDKAVAAAQAAFEAPKG